MCNGKTSLLKHNPAAVIYFKSEHFKDVSLSMVKDLVCKVYLKLKHTDRHRAFLIVRRLGSVLQFDLKR